ncbi:hypothetical protein [Hymenobacter sp. PAMC 26628]|uniref:hypothetical protein n=1 Tax=Hymenobacter sp. PAMC 26628 TaxID=1484118 RepID=UPI00077030C8|nr:hypothetical protein [Hymenobacter sp. PAMC 26628]AMJ65537.1 hypothetical protein AXW84_08910 [Hymenobacter sp. PAMC 26628]
MENTAKDPGLLPGWGIDADPKNDPTYPMRHRMNVGQDPDSKHRPTLQLVDEEVLKSIERQNVSAVFGTPLPPHGLSGAIRRWAFKYSESVYPHWLPLLLADRVDMVEGVLADLVHGHVPNIFAERGAKMDWKYNRSGFIAKLATVSLLTAGAIVLLSSKDEKKPSKKHRRCQA